MSESTNASLTKKSFNYQDTVALGYFIKERQQLDSINVEGKEDIDLNFTIYHGNSGITRSRFDGRISLVG